MQRECCQYKRPKGIRRIREICHVYTIHPTSITPDEFQKIQKEVLGQLSRPMGATTFASPIINDKYYLGVQNFVKGIKILK